jgi:hypothetical protein
MDGPDYFGAIGMGSFCNQPPPEGPFPPPGYDPEMMVAATSKTSTI